MSPKIIYKSFSLEMGGNLSILSDGEEGNFVYWENYPSIYKNIFL